MPVGVSVVPQVTMYLFPSRATSICPQAAGADIGGQSQKCLLADISAPRFAIRDLWNVAAETTGSICLDACELHHLAPLLGFVGDEPAEVSGRHRHRHATQIGEPCFDRGIGEA